MVITQIKGFNLNNQPKEPTMKNQNTIELEKLAFTKTLKKVVTVDGVLHNIEADIRFNDECHNGHNSFSITGTMWEKGKSKDWGIGGCIHDEISKHFPELKPFIKWHHSSSDGPMHYIEDTLYHSEEIKAGIANSWEKRIQFKNLPLSIEIKESFLEFLNGCSSDFDLEILETHHGKHGIEGEYQYSPNYTFGGYAGQWYECPFDTELEAIEYLNCLQKFGFKTVKIANGWTEEKTADLEAARSRAVWPEATLKQLQDKKALKARLTKTLLPNMLKDIKKLRKQVGVQ
jgi:hypothetical protein